MFYATIYDNTGDGPVWKFSTINNEQQFCAENWWTNMLFIGNYFNDEKMVSYH